MRKLAIIGSLMATFAGVGPAQAATYLVTNVSLDNGFNVSIDGGASQLA